MVCFMRQNVKIFITMKDVCVIFKMIRSGIFCAIEKVIDVNTEKERTKNWSRLTLTFSKSTIETLEKGVKYVQS